MKLDYLRNGYWGEEKHTSRAVHDVAWLKPDYCDGIPDDSMTQIGTLTS